QLPILWPDPGPRRARGPKHPLGRAGPSGSPGDGRGNEPSTRRPLGQAECQQLSAVFGALADPTRSALLVQLAKGDATGADLCAPLAVSQPVNSRHPKRREQAGLISRRRRATARLSHLEAEPLREATVWLRRYWYYWGESYERLDALLATLQRES